VLDEQLAIWAVDQITAERRWGNVALFQLMRYATGGKEERHARRSGAAQRRTSPGPP
jgi:hypothetical protein